MNLEFWCWPLAIFSFLYFCYWITPPVLNWVLWWFFPPVNRKVPYVEPKRYNGWYSAMAFQAINQGDFYKGISQQLQNVIPAYRPEDLRNAANTGK